MSRRFPLILWVALLWVFGIQQDYGAVATDTGGKNLSPEQQLQAARWQADQSEQERIKVGRQRNEKRQVYKRDLVAGLQSQLVLRQEMSRPAVKTPIRVTGQGRPILWNVCLGSMVLVGFLYLRKPQWLQDLLISVKNSWAPICESRLPAMVGEKGFSEFASQFTKGPATNPAADTSPDSESFLATPQSQEPGRSDTEECLNVSLSAIGRDLTAIRKLVSDFASVTNEAAREQTVSKLLGQVRSLNAKSGLPSRLPRWQMAYALENLLEQLVHKPSATTPSAMRTVAGAVDLLHALCVPGTLNNLLEEPPVRLLAVDDDAISRHAVALALSKVLTKPDLASDGQGGLALAHKHSYDAIFLDIEMPGMDGFELCSLIHGTMPNRTTPVVFVTSHSGFDDRAKSSLIGGQDLIGKPFLVFELAVKAITIVLRRRLHSQITLSQSLPCSQAPLGELDSNQELILS